MLIGLDDAVRRWDSARWPNFDATEMACPCCAEVWWSPVDFDAAQNVRLWLGRAVSFNSTHRCRLHNAKVGGAPRSEHKKIAFDFSLLRPKVKLAELKNLQQTFMKAGFRTMGLYGTFIHLDRRPGRFWVKQAGRKWLEYFKRQ